MGQLNKVAKNNKGMCIEYGPDLEAKIREVNNLDQFAVITDELVFSFFSSAHSSALEKGYAIDERD